MTGRSQILVAGALEQDGGPRRVARQGRGGLFGQDLAEVVAGGGGGAVAPPPPGILAGRRPRPVPGPEPRRRTLEPEALESGDKHRASAWGHLRISERIVHSLTRHPVAHRISARAASSIFIDETGPRYNAGK